MTVGDGGAAVLLGGVAVLAVGEIGKRRRVRVIGLGVLFAECVMAVVGLLAMA